MSENYPTILLDLWDLWQKETLTPNEETRFSALFYDLEEDMRKACCGPSVDRDAVHGELITLFQESTRESLEHYTKGFLSNDIRKYIANKQNHEGYLLDRKVRKALLTLTESGVVERKKDPRKRIHNLSEFKLSVLPDQCASRPGYEEKMENIGQLSSNYQKDRWPSLKQYLFELYMDPYR